MKSLLFPRLPKIAAAALALLALSAPTSLLAQLKQPCRGLMVRDFSGMGSIPAALQPFIDDVVVMVNWSDLEASDQNFTGTGWTKIDNARTLGTVKIRLRVMAGRHAPQFVKDIGGAGGVTVTNGFDNVTGTVPRWWDAGVQTQYSELLDEIKLRYDNYLGNNILVREVVASGAMTIYAEPFIRSHSHGVSNQNLIAAGLTFTNDQTAHSNVLSAHQTKFTTMRTSIAVNPWEEMAPSSPPNYSTMSLPDTTSFINTQRASMGVELVLQNNGLRDTSYPAAIGSVYEFLENANPPKGFQTATMNNLGNDINRLLAALWEAAAAGANFVELPGGLGPYLTTAVVDELEDIDAALEANPIL